MASMACSSIDRKRMGTVCLARTLPKWRTPWKWCGLHDFLRNFETYCGHPDPQTLWIKGQKGWAAEKILGDNQRAYRLCSQDVPFLDMSTHLLTACLGADRFSLQSISFGCEFRIFDDVQQPS